MTREDVRVGQRFGKLTTVKLVKVTEKYHPWRWECICDCGRRRVIRRDYLTNPGMHKVIHACANCAHTEANDYRRGSPWKRVLGSYRTNAKKRGIAFELTLEEVETLCKGACFYCGHTAGGLVDPASRWPRVIGRNGIDRIDSRKRYTMDNCVSCCSECNWSKSDRSVTEFLSHVKRIYEKSIKERSTTIPTGSTPKRVEMERP
jgi:5-methylcytosine-specific restriction endonuclease McrA